MKTNNLVERFLTYVSFDTQSKPGAKSSPSSQGQLKLAKYLAQELSELGLQDIELSKNGVLTAFLPSNQLDVTNIPTIGFIAHLDTSPQCSGKNVQPEIIENYRGGDIALGLGDEFISPVTFTFLHKLIGKSLIVTDGRTLLGADNKAGIAEIITALANLIQSDVPRCHIRVAFTPDEEIGLGMNYFPQDKFLCNWAYTVDGGKVGELEYENFNAASAVVTISGRDIHPGEAKNKMINALTLGCEFQQLLPKEEVPEKTEDKQGFFHLHQFLGDIGKVELHYLIRDFDHQKFEQRKQFLQAQVQKFNEIKGLRQKAKIEIKDSYYNMYDVVKTVPQSIELAERAMQEVGITPIHQAIRGGTDGAFLAQMGIACPNIFTGGYNFHSKHELITIEGMELAVQVIEKIAELAVS